MTETLVPRTAHLPFTTCPSCGEHAFIATDHDGDVAFRCACCGRAWRYLLGHLVALDPPAGNAW